MKICSLDVKKCGCKIKQYTGGRILILGCDNHKSLTEYVCPICRKKFPSNNYENVGGVIHYNFLQ
jgi:hypothetical protein